jgi:hypothetical protein
MNLKFTKSIRENITFVSTIINIFVALAIAFFGFRGSSDVRDIQSQTGQRAKAKEFQDFWNEMQSITRKANEQSGRFGTAITKFVITSGELLDEYNNHCKRGSLDKLSLDPKYQAAYATYISTGFEVLSSITSVTDEYAFLRIRYSALASIHNIAGWASFANQGEAVATWNADVKAPIDNIANLIDDILTNRKDPAPVISQLTHESRRLVNNLVTKPIPYFNGLSQIPPDLVVKLKPLILLSFLWPLRGSDVA